VRQILIFPSYYLAKVLTTIGITSHRTQNVINLGLQIWNLITGVSGAILTKYFRRRTQYLIAFSMMTVIFACWTGASADYAKTANHQAAGAVVGMIFLYYAFYNFMMPLTYIYITEVRFLLSFLAITDLSPIFPHEKHD